jgi:deoxyribodipyrimidine photo-lyase
MRPILFWFRRNLRLTDNDALIAAADSDRPIIPVYVVDGQDCGQASRWWLHNSLARLDRDLGRMGGRLVLRKGEPEQVLSQLATDTGATALYYCRRHEPASRAQEDALRREMSADVAVHEFDDGLLHDPDSVLSTSNAPYRVFTSFWRAASKTVNIPSPAAAPTTARFTGQSHESLELSELGLVPAALDSLGDSWTPGESAALARIEALESTTGGYNELRDRPDIDGTSRLSPHLHFGELSPRQAWHAVHRQGIQIRDARGSEALLRQLWWREFSSYLLHHFPQLPLKPLREEYDEIPWLDRPDDFEAWTQGRTGYPLVDAGMRQLGETGWMHNRVRMVAASFLVKHLLVPWQKGAAWFLDRLVDADLANNSANWQWVAGTGTDAAPYFRIFNPELQAKKFDAQGRYVSRWVPEAMSGDYMPPIVEHKAARHRALEAYKSSRGRRTSKQAP